MIDIDPVLLIKSLRHRLSCEPNHHHHPSNTLDNTVIHASIQSFFFLFVSFFFYLEPSSRDTRQQVRVEIFRSHFLHDGTGGGGGGGAKGGRTTTTTKHRE